MSEQHTRGKRNVKIPESLDIRLRVRSARERRHIGSVVGEALEAALPALDSCPWNDWVRATEPPPADPHWEGEPLQTTTVLISLDAWQRLNVAAIAHRMPLHEYLARVLNARLPALD